MSYSLIDVLFEDTGQAAESGVDYEFDTFVTHAISPFQTSIGDGANSSSSDIMREGFAFDPDVDPVFEGETLEENLVASSSADSEGSQYSTTIQTDTAFTVQIYTEEALTFVWQYSYTVDASVENNDADGGQSNAFANATVSWYGDTTAQDSLTFIDHLFVGGCCGTPSTPSISDSGSFDLIFEPGETLATFEFAPQAGAFNNDLAPVPEPSAAFVALVGLAAVSLRRVRRA